jgi:adenylate cyclase
VTVRIVAFMESTGTDLNAVREAFARGDVVLAYDAASAAVTANPDDLDARFFVALALVRAGARDRARVALDELITAVSGASDVRADLLEDAEALEGRLAKDVALAAGGSERAALAATAAQLYERVADRYDRYFTCVNAATLWLVAGSPARARTLAERALELTRTPKADDSPTDAYWRAATEAEAWLVLGNVDKATTALAVAAAIGADDVAARAVTGRQLRVLCETAGIDVSLLESLALPSVLHYCGHRISPDSEKAGGFAPSEEAAVVEQVGEFLDDRTLDAAYGALACGADIIIAEAVLERGVPLHVVLPFDSADFETSSVCSGGNGWSARYRACLERATTVTITYDSAYTDDPTLFGYASRVAMGHALHRGQQLGVDAEQLAVWDGEAGDVNAGTGHDVAAWRAAGRPAHVVPVRHRRSLREAREATTPRVIGAMLFTDVRGFSRLRDEHQLTFVDGVLQPCADVLDAFGAKIEYRNTWGDAILAVCSDVATAASAALALQDVMTSLELASLGLPEDLDLRVGAHVGPLITRDDPVRRVPALWGRELTRAARIEPRTPEGEVYVTDAFAALCTLECGHEFACEYVGRVTTAKQFETIPMFRLRRA